MLYSGGALRRWALNCPLIYGYPFPPESSSHLCGLFWVIRWIPHGCAHCWPYHVLYGVHIGAFCRPRHHDVNVVGLQKRTCWPYSVHCTDQPSCINSICCLFAKLLTKDWRPGINVPKTNDEMSFASDTLHHHRPLVLLTSEGGVSKSLPNSAVKFSRACRVSESGRTIGLKRLHFATVSEYIDDTG